MAAFPELRQEARQEAARATSRSSAKTRASRRRSYGKVTEVDLTGELQALLGQLQACSVLIHAPVNRNTLLAGNEIAVTNAISRGMQDCVQEVSQFSVAILRRAVSLTGSIQPLDRNPEVTVE